MPVKFILGRAGVGKTHHCLSAIRHALTEPGDARLMLLVPEQASFQMERALATASPRHGYARAEVLSFTRLAFRVWDELGAAPPLISPGARAVALRTVAAQDADRLRVFRTAAQTAGFFQHLDRLIEELLLAGVMPEALAAAAEQLESARGRAKAEEVVRLYAGYLDWLGPDRVDPALRLRLLRERLTQLPWLRDARIWVDGFAGFTGQELQTLVTLGQYAHDLHITLLLEPTQGEEESQLFRRTRETYLQLKSLMSAAGVEVVAPQHMPLPPRRTSASPALTALEAGIAAGGGDAVVDDSVRVLACETHRDEVRAAARTIRTMVAESEGGLHYRDFALIARDLEPFADDVAAIFAEYEIPHFLDRRRPMRGHPLTRLIQALVDAALTDCSTSAMARLLRTDLLPMTRDEAERLENAVVNHAVRGARTWQRPRWDFENELALTQRPRAESDDPTRAARLRLASALAPLLTQRETRQDGAAWARLMLATLDDLEVPGRLEQWIDESRRADEWEAAEVHRLAWETLCAVLDDVHAVLGDTETTLRELGDVLASALSDTTLGLAPPTLDQVLVSSIDRSRHPEIKHAWLMEFNEGVFPARPADDCIFTALERAALRDSGLPAPTPNRDDVLDELLLAYVAVTRPSDSLTISYARSDEAGEAVQPSPLLDDIRRALPTLEAVDDRSATAPPITLRELARRALAPPPGADAKSALQRRLRCLSDRVARSPAWAETWQRLSAGQRYDNRDADVGPYRVDGAPPTWHASPTELETRIDCPFKHFARYGLQLDTQRGPMPARVDLGSLAHKLLAAVTQRGIHAPQSPADITDTQWGDWWREEADKWHSACDKQLADRRPQLAFLSSLQAERTGEVLMAHVQRWRRGKFGPLAVEQTLRDADYAWPPLKLDVAGGRVQISGKIDRVDVCEDDGVRWLAIYDYKQRAYPPTALVLVGEMLQIMLYADAALRVFDGARLAGVLIAPLRPDAKVLDAGYYRDAAEHARAMYLYRPRGWVCNNAVDLFDGDGGQGPSPVISIQRKNDGGFYKNRDNVAASELDARLQQARDTVATAAAGLLKGEVSPAPLFHQRTLACRRCSYAPLCRFDRFYNEPRVSEQALPVLDQPSSEQGA